MRVLEKVIKQNPNEPEFHQGINWKYSLRCEPYVDAHLEYEKGGDS